MFVRVRPERFLLFLAIGFLPVYLFASGGIQIAHVVFLMFSALVMVKQGVSFSLWSWMLLLISLWSLCVEATYVLLGADPQAVLNGAFFLYNFIIAISVHRFVAAYGLGPMVPGLWVAGLIAVSTVLYAGLDMKSLAEEGRSVGTFNNPNQLGYFSVCFLSMTYLLYVHKRINYLTAIIMFSGAIFLSVASLSKAAMIANFLVIFFALKPVGSQGIGVNPSGFGSRFSAAFWLVIAMSLVSLALSFYVRGAFNEYLFAQRLQGMASEEDSSLAARGYFAVVDGNVIQILLGLGSEGVLERVGHEVHSTLGGVLNNYGIAGLLIFGAALAVWCARLWSAYGFAGFLSLAGPAMLYGISHNGVRFTIFWVLFAASLAMADRTRAERVVASRNSSSGFGGPVLR